MNPSSSAFIAGALPMRWVHQAALVAGVLILPIAVGAVGGNYWVRVLDFAMLYVMLALGLNIVVGFAGLLDLGYIAFYAVGAYVAALLSSPHLSANFAVVMQWAPEGLKTSFWLMAVAGLVLAAVFGVLLGAPTLGLRGDYLAIVTLGFGEIVRIFLNNLDQPLNLTNGPKGIAGIEPIRIFGIDFGQTHTVGGIAFPPVYLYFYLFAAAAVLIVWVCARLQGSRVGRAWAAIRDDEIAAKATGINTRNLKLMAFATGSSVGGLCGVLFGAFQGFVSPESFTFWESVVVLACVVLGGMGHLPGVVLGAVLLSVFPEVLRSTVEPVQDALFGRQVVDGEILRQFLYGVAMVLVMLFRREGLWPAARRRVASRPPTTVQGAAPHVLAEKGTGHVG